MNLNALGVNKATDMFILKFLLCDKRNQDGSLPKDEETEEEDEKDEDKQSEKEESDADGDFTITDKAAAKKYAITSYLKLLTARVLRLEEEMARHKKVSVIMYDDGKASKPEPEPSYVADPEAAAIPGENNQADASNGQEEVKVENVDADKSLSPAAKRSADLGRLGPFAGEQY